MGSTSALIHNLHLNNPSCFKCLNSNRISRTSLLTTTRRNGAKLKLLISRNERKKLGRVVCCSGEDFSERQQELNSQSGGGLGSAVEDRPGKNRNFMVFFF